VLFRSTDALVDLAPAAEKAKEETEGLGKSTEKAGKKAKEAKTGFEALGAKLAGLGLGVAAYQFLKLADASKLLEGRLKVLGLEGIAVTRTQEQLRDVANATRSEFADVTELYSRLSRSAQQLGASQKDLLTVTTAITQAAVVSGATNQEAAGAIRQLSQGLASGTLRGEELNSVMESMPRLAQAITDSMGITTGQLRSMAAEGKITSEEVFNALIKQAPQLANEFSKTAVTIGGASNQLKNSIQQVAGEFEKATGATSMLATVIQTFANNTSALVAVLGTAGLATAIAVATVAFGKFTAALAAGSIALAPMAAALAAAAAAGWAFYEVMEVLRLNKSIADSDAFTKSLNEQVKARNALVAAGKTNAQVNAALEKQFGGALVIAKMQVKLEKDAAGAINLTTDATEKQAAAVDTTSEVLAEQAEHLKAVQKAWYEFFLGLTKESPLPLMAHQLEMVAESALPPEKALSAWQNFIGYITTELGFSTENIGTAFAQTFENIAARGKATMADLFSTIGGMFDKGTAGSAVFGGLGVAGSVVGGALAGRSAEVEQAKAARAQFQKEINEFNAMLSRWATDIGGYATDLDEAIESVNRTFDDQARQLRDIFDAANQTYNVDTAKNLDAYNKAYAALVKLRDDEIKRITELNEKKKAEFADEVAIRSLLVAGLNDQAELVRQEIAQAKELAEAKRLGIDTTELEILQLQERNKLLERQERERGFTISGLDAAIAREGGDSDLADQIERDIERQRILAEVTDATIKAKYEELWALEDTNRAAREAAEAIQLLADQAAISEDLEVRKLMATGKTMEAEELRFQLEQKRELARAEADFASGLITQDILDQLREVLGLEADAFANRNQQTGESTTFGGASTSPTRSGGTQTTGSFAGAQVQDIDRVVGELTTIRVRAGQLVQLMTALVRGGGILGVVNAGIQGQTQNQSLLNGNLVVS
jgi:tape measure domain-containing protein